MCASKSRIALKQADFKLETLPPHLFMNFKVVDEHGRQLAMGRNLAQLRAELGGQAQQHFQKVASSAAGAALADVAGTRGQAAALCAGRCGVAQQGRSGAGAADCDARRRRHRVVRKPDDVEFRQAARSCSKFAAADRRCSVIRL